MSLWKYKYFLDVVELKSFTKAGARNYVTQTAVSQQIASLEKMAGGTLLERGNGEIRLTELGEIVYAYAKEMVQTHEQMLHEIERYKESSVVCIGIDSSINKLFWAKMQKMINDKHSEADFRFSKLDSYIGSRMLRENTLDIYIGYGLSELEQPDEIGEKPLLSSRIGAYIGLESSINEQPEFKAKDLERYTRYGTKSYLCSVMNGQKNDPQLLTQGIELVDNVDTMKLKVEFNDGYALADSQYFSYSDGDMLLLPGYDGECVIKAFYRKKRNKKKVKEVLEEIKNVVKS